MTVLFQIHLKFYYRVTMAKQVNDINSTANQNLFEKINVSMQLRHGKALLFIDHIVHYR